MGCRGFAENTSRLVVLESVSLGPQQLSARRSTNAGSTRKNCRFAHQQLSARRSTSAGSSAAERLGDAAQEAPAPGQVHGGDDPGQERSEEHTSELQSLMRISYAVFCLKKKNKIQLKNRQSSKETVQHI